MVSFPLYVEAIHFAFHEESMVRTAIRALTLNVYHGEFRHFLINLRHSQLKSVTLFTATYFDT